MCHVVLNKNTTTSRYDPLSLMTKSPYDRLCHSNDLVSGYRRDVGENCVLLGYYEASSGNFVPAFRDNGSIGCPETSVKYYYSLNNNVRKKLPLLAA